MKKKTPNLMTAVIALVLLSARRAYGYIDPGTLGILSQVGYLVFYGLVAVLAFFFRPIKTFFLALLEKITGKKFVKEEIVEEDEEDEDKKQSQPQDNGNGHGKDIPEENPPVLEPDGIDDDTVKKSGS